MKIKIDITTFDGAKFAKKYDLQPEDFRIDGDELICDSLESFTVEDCLADIWNDVRRQRDYLLKKSDWTQLEDAPVDKKAWKDYRKALRDITSTFATPEEVIFPDEPVSVI